MSKKLIDLLEKETTRSTSFIGDQLNSYAAYYYFVTKYPNSCLAAVTFTMFPNKKYVSRFSIEWTCEFIENKCRRYLHIPNLFESAFQRCLDNPNVRFIFGEISLRYHDDTKAGDSHANSFVYDKLDNSIEIFEPWGKREYDNKLFYDSDAFNEAITRYFQKTFGVDKVYTDFCPAISFQLLEEKNMRLPTDAPGFCNAWWWIDFRLANAESTQDRVVLVREAIALLSEKPQYFKAFIRNYANFLVKLKHILIQKSVPSAKESQEIIKRLTNYDEEYIREKINRAELAERNEEIMNLYARLGITLTIMIYCQHLSTEYYRDELLEIAKYNNLPVTPKTTKKELCEMVLNKLGITG